MRVAKRVKQVLFSLQIQNVFRISSLKLIHSYVLIYIIIFTPV